MATLCYTESMTRRREQIESGLLKLMEVCPYAEITVKDICQKAGIPRRTFYRYFESKEDVLDSLIDELFSQCLSDRLLSVGLPKDELFQGFLEIFRFWYTLHRGKLDAIIQNGVESRLFSRATRKVQERKLHLLAAQTMDPKLMEIILMVGITNFFTLLFHWSRGGYRESPEIMARYAIEIMPQGYFKG